MRPRNSVCAVVSKTPSFQTDEKRTVWFVDFKITVFQNTHTDEVSTRKAEVGP